MNGNGKLSFSSGRRSALLVGLALAMVMVNAQPALAAQVSFASGVVGYFGASTETNNVLISTQAGPPRQVVLEELGGVGIAPTAPCSSVTVTKAICPDATQIRVSAGFGNDSVTNVTSIPSVLEGGLGADVLRGGSAGDRLLGQEDNDTLLGAGLHDLLDGGPGDDLFEGLGPVAMPGFPFGGSDTIIGGDGFDRMFYFARTNPVFVELDNIANDGEAGENDNVRSDVEWVSGGSGNDTILARAGAQQIFGRAGNDHLAGGSGTDVIDGGEGIDDLSYRGRTSCAVNVSFDGQPNDGCTGAPAENDSFASIEGVFGSELGDVLTGGPGSETLRGMGGNDRINANDGVADTVSCGDGSDDNATVDLKDSVTGCENVQRAAVDQFPNVAIGRRALRATPNDRVRVRLICPVEWTPGCTGTLRLRTLKGRGLGKADYSIAPGDSERVRIALNRLGRRLADREGSVRIRAEANELDRNGLPKTTIQTLGLT